MNADADKNPALAQAVRGLRQIAKLTRKVRGTSSTFDQDSVSLEPQAVERATAAGMLAGAPASACIEALLRSSQPAMICRLGTIELAAMSAGKLQVNTINVLRLLAGDGAVRDIGLHDNLVGALCSNAGFFPNSIDQSRRFIERMVQDLQQVDILGSWCRQEANFGPELRKARRVRFRDLEPYMHDQPWTRALAGRKVLVVHPFADTIASQYRQHREQLFDNPGILPPFELSTLRAVQSLADTKVPFDTWFDALAHMERQMTQADWDVAIIGCGAYGLPLAAHAKRLGRQGIHLGGQTQLLFGIKGKRWETGHERIKALFNPNWVYPSEADRPEGYKRVEGGAYW